jgi:hypothetical protein
MSGSALDPMRNWNQSRTGVPLPKESFRGRWKKDLGKKGIANGK